MSDFQEHQSPRGTSHRRT